MDRMTSLSIQLRADIKVADLKSRPVLNFGTAYFGDMEFDYEFEPDDISGAQHLEANSNIIENLFLGEIVDFLGFINFMNHSRLLHGPGEYITPHIENITVRFDMDGEFGVHDGFFNGIAECGPYTFDFQCCVNEDNEIEPDDLGHDWGLSGDVNKQLADFLGGYEKVKTLILEAYEIYIASLVEHD